MHLSEIPISQQVVISPCEKVIAAAINSIIDPEIGPFIYFDKIRGNDKYGMAFLSEKSPDSEVLRYLGTGTEIAQRLMELRWKVPYPLPQPAEAEKGWEIRRGLPSSSRPKNYPYRGSTTEKILESGCPLCSDMRVNV